MGEIPLRFRYTPQALAELDEVLSEIAVHSRKGADRVSVRLRGAIERLADYPKSGQPTRLHELRRFALTPYPYIVFYRIADDGVVVIAIRHAARDPSSMPC